MCVRIIFILYDVISMVTGVINQHSHHWGSPGDSSSSGPGAGVRGAYPPSCLEPQGGAVPQVVRKVGNHGNYHRNMWVSWNLQLLVGGLEHFLFSHILGIIIPID